jgi:antitoxin ParD1/3/4
MLVARLLASDFPSENPRTQTRNFPYTSTLCVIWLRYQDLVYLIKILVKMGKNTSISLGNHFEDFIREEVNSGRYGSVSEVIRSALRLLEREEKKERELIKALEVGENSGFVENFDPKQNLTELHRQHL